MLERALFIAGCLFLGLCGVEATRQQLGAGYTPSSGPASAPAPDDASTEQDAQPAPAPARAPTSSASSEGAVATSNGPSLGPQPKLRLDWDSAEETPCGGPFFRPGALPAVREDGEVIAYLDGSADNLGMEVDRDIDLVMVEVDNHELERVPLWRGRTESLDSRSCHRMRRVFREQLAVSRALLGASRWRALERLPEHIDENGTPSECADVRAQWERPSPSDTHINLTCGGRPHVLELALTPGPNLVLRVPRVRVVAKRALGRLEVPVEWSWDDPKWCQSRPLLYEAWRDPLSSTYLVEFTDARFTSDACGLDNLVRVVVFDDYELPERLAELDLPQVRQFTSLGGF